MTQFASVEGNFPDSITCVCGNTCSSSGMIQCNEDGIAFHVYNGEVPTGLVEMPEDPAKLYMVCPDCGAVYSDQTIIETAKAPVIKTVNIIDGPAAESFKIHWALGD
jgi:hypothetical protein